MKNINFIKLIIIFCAIYLLIPCNSFSYTIEEVVNKTEMKRLISANCKAVLDKEPTTSDLIKIGNASIDLAIKNYKDKKHSLELIREYITILNILYADRTIETTYTMLQDGAKLKERFIPFFKELKKLGIVSGELNHILNTYDSEFIPWAVPYIKEQCKYEF